VSFGRVITQTVFTVAVVLLIVSVRDGGTHSGQGKRARDARK